MPHKPNPIHNTLHIMPNLTPNKKSHNSQLLSKPLPYPTTFSVIHCKPSNIPYQVSKVIEYCCVSPAHTHTPKSNIQSVKPHYNCLETTAQTVLPTLVRPYHASEDQQTNPLHSLTNIWFLTNQNQVINYTSKTTQSMIMTIKGFLININKKLDQLLSTLPMPMHTSPKRKKDPYAASPSMAPDTQATLNYQDHVTNQLHMSPNLYDFMIALPPITYILGLLLPNKQIDTQPTTIRMIHSENLHRSSPHMQH